MILSSDDVVWLQINHPDLYVDADRRHISGELAFKMFYTGDHGEAYVINPDRSYEDRDGTLIEDVYEIDIQLDDNSTLPEIREIGGRIAESLRIWNIEDSADLHIYPNGSLCLCVTPEIDLLLPHGFNAEDFFCNLLIPYLFYQSYFEQFGKEPWPGYGHGDMGILESLQKRIETGDQVSHAIICSYLDSLSKKMRQRILVDVEVKGHHNCLCGSKTIARKCHKKAMYGYNSLRRFYKLYPVT